MTARVPIPVSLFAMPVGILGLAGAWNAGVRIWNLPGAVAFGITLGGVAVWGALVVLYVRKWAAHGAAARSEARDPVQSSFVSLVLISTMLAAVAMLRVWPVAATLLFAIAVLSEMALGAWLLGRLWQGGQGTGFVTPALYLPTVGQSFVAANGAAQMGWTQIAGWLFGCGVLSWLAIESLVLVRAATSEPMPMAQRASLGVQLAPPVVGGLAYLSLTTGTPDLVAHMLFGYGLLQAALLLRLTAWIRQSSFTPSYWSVSFGVTALPTMAMRMVERGDAGPMAWAATILFASANLVVGYLALATLWLLVRPPRAVVREPA